MTLQKTDYKELKTCLAYGGNNLTKFLDFSNQPLANSFTKAPTKLKEYPLQVNACKDCSHSQLSVAVDPEVLFSDYCYVSGTTQTLKVHFSHQAGYARNTWIEDRVDSYKALTVLDIGSNDGTALYEFKRMGFVVQGVDPAANLKPLSEEKGVPVETAFWSYEFAKQWKRKFCVINACNVLAHQQNPEDFLLGVKEALYHDGIAFIQFPYMKNTLETNDFGQIYHEHCNYFTVKSFQALCNRVGLKIGDVRFFAAIHGGTIEFALKHPEAPWSGPNNLLSFLIKEENLDYSGYAEKIDYNLNKLADTIMELDDSGYKVITYGAAAKSSTPLNSKFKAYTNFIRYVVDDSSSKVGRYCPGSNIPIYHPSELLTELKGQIALLLVTHNFKTEILQRLRSMGIKGLLVNYVPEVSVEEI